MKVKDKCKKEVKYVDQKKREKDTVGVGTVVAEIDGQLEEHFQSKTSGWFWDEMLYRVCVYACLCLCE